MLATRITCSALRVSVVGISSLEKSCRGQPSALLQAWRLSDVLLLPTSSYKAVSGEMPPEVVGQKTSNRSVCGLARRSAGWRGGERHAFSWARRRDTGFIEASGAMFFLLRRAIGDWHPFSSSGLGANATSRRNRSSAGRSASPAPPRNSRRQASRRPSPPRAPLPRRRVRRGCADPAPPAGPSGAAGSRQPLGTLRSPPRPRGAANRAGERVTPLFLLEPPGPVAQRT